MSSHLKRRQAQHLSEIYDSVEIITNTNSQIAQQGFNTGNTDGACARRANSIELSLCSRELGLETRQLSLHAVGYGGCIGSAALLRDVLEECDSLDNIVLEDRDDVCDDAAVWWVAGCAEALELAVG